MKVLAIIQARMGSARFPRKVLADLAGKPVIWHLLHRVSQCSLVDEVCVATSAQPADDDLAEYVTSLGIRVVRGSEANVLQRLIKAAREAAAEIIVRVTGDAPLVDPASLDAQISGMINARADFCISDQAAANINEGFEAFTMAALTKLDQEAGADPIAVEHTCSYFKKHPGFVKTVELPVPEELQYRGARVSVDTPPDLEFLNLLHQRLSAAAGEIDIRDVVRLLRAEPDLTLINAAVTQKKAGSISRTAVIRCDASAEIGLGHIIRCLALAEVLRDEQSFGITFVTAASDVASRFIAEHRHSHVTLDSAQEPWPQLEAHLVETKPDLLVLDVRDGVPRDVVAGIRQRTNILTVSIDDPEDKRLACDLLFYPPVPQVERMEWTELHGERLAGWDWVLLRRQFHAAHAKKVQSNATHGEKLNLLVTMGGSDPAGMTLKAARALKNVSSDFHVIFVLGAAFCHEPAFQEELATANYSYEIQRTVTAMGELMLRADAALACFSVTAYELATVGVPSIFLALSEDHEESASAFVKAGIGQSLGLHHEVSEQQITQAVTEILMDTSRRLSMTELALSMTDGLGARRISEKIIHQLEQRA